MSIAGEFKEFIAKGNVIDLAVGVVIGGAFGKIVTSLVEKIIMPFVGLLTGGVDFSAWSITLKDAVVDATGTETAPALVLGLGDFVNTIIQFLIIAFAIFMVVKAINKVRKPAVAEDAPPPEDVLLLREIRDSLKK
ncbi:MAG: large-conductance mechanosensitive channel protein MscL [Pseudoxanthomonas sp.]